MLAFFFLFSLVGSASEGLWDLDANLNDMQVISLLKQRFGSRSRCEAHRQQLKALRWKPNQTLQNLYLQVRKLLTLTGAYPGEMSSIFETIGCDSFLKPLCDTDFKTRILDQRVPSLDSAYDLASQITIASKLNLPISGILPRMSVVELGK